ncbi:hypothetical protein M0D21_04810 [Aquimarina sp. D1M17]|uniref:hypothetical protein n=1 Tax=Aquimarina acroporae TaxID=2937283 RepID=UPI0020BE4036|nr:hypothetical protein [Aquimarina acroporae]MCK8520872.1 hypothetical protein [Aquimarina acroporae]
MKKVAKIWFSVVFVLFLGFMWMMVQTFKPVRNVQPEDVLTVKGTVTKIEEGPGLDLVITLKGDEHYYYINRGLQQGLTVEQTRLDILNKTVTLYPIKRWTIFTRDGNMGHISKLMLKDKVIYNEINNDIHEKTIQ